jgi:hypothetical protein
MARRDRAAHGSTPAMQASTGDAMAIMDRPVTPGDDG